MLASLWPGRLTHPADADLVTLEVVAPNPGGGAAVLSARVRVGERVPARRPTPVLPPAPPAPLENGRVEFHPRYAEYLRKLGLTSADAVRGLVGEVVCGHPDRHVCRVELGAGGSKLVAYLKREHTASVRARLKNLWAGFGYVSRAEREAAVLKDLEARGLPGPQWLAVGVDAAGRAFLLVAEVPASSDLREVLDQGGLDPAARRRLAHRVGVGVAELHVAGLHTPELAAKHAFVRRDLEKLTLIDWQSAAARPVTPADAARALATLHSSLRPGLATPRERLRALRVYWKAVAPTWPRAPKFTDFARDVVRRSAARSRRSSVRDQHHAAATRFVWLAGEAACVPPEFAPHWPAPADGPPFYPATPSTMLGSSAAEEWLTFPGGRRALLVRFRSFDPLGRLAATLREKPWRSPAAEAARVLVHLHRHGVPAPTLLGFGQKLRGPAHADSFVLIEPPRGTAPVAVRLAQLARSGAARRRLIEACGTLLRQLHDAGLRLDLARAGRPVFLAGAGAGAEPVQLESPFVVRRSKRITARVRRRDLALLFHYELAALSRPERLRAARAYAGTPADVKTDRRWRAAAVRGTPR